MREEEGDGGLGAEDEEEEEEVVQVDLEVVEEDLEVEEEDLEVEEEGACFLRYKWRARAVVESPPRQRFTERSIVVIF